MANKHSRALAILLGKVKKGETELELPKDILQWTDSDWSALQDALDDNETVKSIRGFKSALALDRSYQERLCTIMLGCKNLSSLNVQSGPLKEDKQLEALLFIVENSPRISNFDFSNCRMGNQICHRICKILKKEHSPRLVSINFSHNNLTLRSVAYIIALLKACKKLVKIDLTRNKISSHGKEKLVEALSDEIPPTFHEFLLDGNGVDAKQPESIKIVQNEVEGEKSGSEDESSTSSSSSSSTSAEADEDEEEVVVAHSPEKTAAPVLVSPKSNKKEKPAPKSAEKKAPAREPEDSDEDEPVLQAVGNKKVKEKVAVSKIPAKKAAAQAEESDSTVLEQSPAAKKKKPAKAAKSPAMEAAVTPVRPSAAVTTSSIDAQAPATPKQKGKKEPKQTPQQKGQKRPATEAEHENELFKLPAAMTNGHAPNKKQKQKQKPEQKQAEANGEGQVLPKSVAELQKQLKAALKERDEAREQSEEAKAKMQTEWSKRVEIETNLKKLMDTFSSIRDQMISH